MKFANDGSLATASVTLGFKLKLVIYEIMVLAIET